MSGNIRLTVAQALVRFLGVQYSESDGAEQKLFAQSAVAELLSSPPPQPAAPSASTATTDARPRRAAMPGILPCLCGRRHRPEQVKLRQSPR